VGRRLVAASLATLLVSIVIACGSQSDERGGAPPAKSAETSSTSAATQPIIRDIAALRRAADAGQSDEAVDALNHLFDAAQSRPDDREGWKGTALIRKRLPRILNRFLTDYPRTRRRLSRVGTLTPSGAAVKAWLLVSYESQRRELLRLRADVAKGTYAWGAVLRWSGENDAAIAESDRQLRSILRKLPVTQRWTVDRAIRQPPGR
jgi:hypothetical protein